MSVIAIVIISVIAFILFVSFVCTFNSLIKAKNKVKESFSSIDVHLKLRYDLIPNLVNVVKGYTKHEELIMSQVADLRKKAVEAETQKQKIKIANESGAIIKRLFATSEAYPELKSNKLFKRLSRELVEIEDKISAARRFYNSEINRYNNLVMQFPTNIIAKIFGFKKLESFEIERIEKTDILVGGRFDSDNS